MYSAVVQKASGRMVMLEELITFEAIDWATDLE
jgi:hypothetical protein